MTLPVVITAHPKRQLADALRAEVEGHLGDVDVVISRTDRPREVMPRALQMGLWRHPNAPWLLYLEDDIVLGPAFHLLRELLAELEARWSWCGLASFFSVVHGIDSDGWSTHPMIDFCHLQCVAIRTEHLSRVPHWCDFVYAHAETNDASDADKVLGFYMAMHYPAWALWTPSLVQHLPGPSMLRPDYDVEDLRSRMSPTYRRSYGEIPL